MTENRIVWKSDHQGVKEKTFIQTGRRGRYGQLGREDSRQGGGWWTQRGGGLWSGASKTAAIQQGSSWQTRRDSAWWSGQSHIHVGINQEERWGSKTDCITQGSRVGI